MSQPLASTVQPELLLVLPGRHPGDAAEFLAKSRIAQTQFNGQRAEINFAVRLLQNPHARATDERRLIAPPRSI